MKIYIIIVIVIVFLALVYPGLCNFIANLTVHQNRPVD